MTIIIDLEMTSLSKLRDILMGRFLLGNTAG